MKDCEWTNGATSLIEMPGYESDKYDKRSVDEWILPAYNCDYYKKSM